MRLVPLDDRGDGGATDAPVSVDHTAKKKFKLTPVDAPPVKKPKDTYLSESLGALKTGAKEFAEGAVETVKGMGRDYMTEAAQHPGFMNMAQPIYSAGAALRGLASSPAAEFAESAVLGAGGVEAGPSHNMRLKDEPVAPNRVATALRSDRAPPTPPSSKTEPLEAVARPPSKGVELPPSREGATPPSAPAAAPKLKLTPLGEAKPEAETPQFSIIKNKDYKSTIFPGTDQFSVKDANGKHVVNVIANREGDKIQVHAIGGKEGEMSLKNTMGTTTMRKILPELQKQYPGATSIGGTRITGARARSAGKGSISSKTTEVTLPSGTRAAKEGEILPPQPPVGAAPLRPNVPERLQDILTDADIPLKKRLELMSDDEFEDMQQRIADSHGKIPSLSNRIGGTPRGGLPPINPDEPPLRPSAPGGIAGLEASPASVVSRNEVAPSPRQSAPGAGGEARRYMPQSVGAAPTGYPELSTGGKGGAQAILQQRLGLGEREASKAITTLEPFQRELNAAPRSERLKVIDYMENRSHGNISIDPKFQAAANEMRRVYKDIQYKLEGTKSTGDMGFIEDYFRHQVKDPKKIPSFMSAFKEGSARGATKKRSFPTVTDLLQAGHELVNDNPVEVTMDYAYHMNKFIATNEAFDIAKEQGTIKMMSPSRVPEGYLPIEGRHGGLNSHGQANYAPAEFAKPWNNFVGQGFTGLGGDILHGARSITNAVTAVKLMSGYHFATMGAASFTSELARAFDNVAYGRPMAGLRAGGSAMSVLGPAIRQFKTGLRGQKIYAGRAGSGEESKIIDYLTQANFRPSKIDRSISVTQTGNLYTAWKRGALSHQVRAQMSDIAAAPGIMKAAPIARGVWGLFGRTIDTIMAPLFEKTIPALKTGAAMESLRDFLVARPASSFEEIMTEARAVQKNMDDRFGEMNHDNLFWNQKLKEGLQASMLSYSWNVGIGRAIGGGGKDIIEALGKKATMGKFGSAGWTRRASYALAFPIGAAYLSAVYQALKTAQAPKGPQDLLAPRTGGVNPANKHRRESDERIAVPGHMKDVFEMRDLFTGDKTVWDIAANKLNPMLRTAGDMISGHDWRGHRISDPEANTQTKIKQYLSYAIQGSVEPIFMSQLGQKKEGTNINLFETILGIHPAPDFLQDPTGHGDMIRAKANKDYIGTLSALENEAKRRGDSGRATAFQQDIHRRQQQIKRLQQ